MNVPFTYIRVCSKIEKGETIERSLTTISEERERIVDEYRKLIKSETIENPLMMRLVL